MATGVSREVRDARPAMPGVGDILQGRFSLVALIGEGGMSRVFKAVDLRRVEAGAADPHVAIKILTEPFHEYLGSLAALEREAHKLQSLGHPNIVRVIDCDRDGQTVFMTMEYLAGEPLQKKLRAPGRSRLDPGEAESIVMAVAEALAYAHKNHIVHGDLKPGNVIITERGEVKVIDFGMARFIARPGGAVELPSQRFARTPKAVTARYASPEMLAGADPEPTDDVYALGCLAYEVLCGKHPFGRQKEVVTRDPRAILPRLPGLRDNQYTALSKALAYERSRRTASVREFLDDYRAAPQRRGRAWWIALGALATLALLLGAVHRWSGPRLATTGAGAVIRDCPTCPLMTLLPPGAMLQGAAAGDSKMLAAQLPQHPVSIARRFAMSSSEITVAEFREFAADSHRNFAGCITYDADWQFQRSASWQAPGYPQTAMHPVVCVSWSDAVAYAQWLTKKTGHAYRLPSASEWEYGARAGATVDAPWDRSPWLACANANVADQTAGQRFPGWEVFPCNDGYAETAPVGSFVANGFGLNDMLGNVFEWVSDCWHDDYVGAPSDGSPRLDGDCREHELRGGSWFSLPQFVGVGYRNRFPADYRSSSIGVRLVREVAR